MSLEPYAGGVADIRMVVTDMDGTLLTSDHTIPESFWPVLELMRLREILLVPASGRQYSAIAHLFPDHTGIAFIAENGSYVRVGGEIVSTTTLHQDAVADVVHTVRSLNDPNVGTVVCGINSAYIERSDAPFVEQVNRYFRKLKIVENLDDVNDSVLKMALFSFDDIAQTVYPHLSALATSPQVVVSAEHWIDIIDPHVNKGVGVRTIQEMMGVPREQTAVFGDYLNDVQMLDDAAYSFAMANARAEVKERARYVARSNDDAGVVVALRQLLGIADT